MKTEQIVETIKATYTRDIRKQLIQNIIDQEMGDDMPNYKLIDQIFSYIISECSWTIAENSKKWDDTPLIVLQNSFPKIKNTKWYKSKSLTVGKKD